MPSSIRPPGSDITIEWNRKGDFIYISVADNGPGIPDQAKPHVFEMFYTVSNQIVDSRRSMDWVWHCANPSSMRMEEKSP